MPDSAPKFGFYFKLIFAMGFLLAVGFLIISSTMFSILKITKAQNNFLEHEVQELQIVESLKLRMAEQMSTMPLFVLSGDYEHLKKNGEANRSFSDDLSRLQKLSQDTESLILLENIRTAHQQLIHLSLPGIEMKKHGASIAKVNRYFTNAPAAQATTVSEAIDDFEAKKLQNYHDTREQNKINTKYIINTLSAATVASVILFFFVSTLLIQLVRRKKADEIRRSELHKKELELSDARKKTIEVVAHDLRNPLSGIVMSAEMASRQIRKGSGVDMPHTLQVVLRSAQSMQRLINDLLDHAKIEAGSLELNRTSSNVASILQDIFIRFTPLADLQSIRLSKNITLNETVAFLDITRIDQVISNLLGNALKFTKNGGEVSIEAKIMGKFAIIAVTDTGPGIPSDQLPHIFKRYWQVRETSQHGMGLGLSIAQSIVHAHEGDIWVESQVGQGSVFSFSLPIFIEPLVDPPEEKNLSHHNV